MKSALFAAALALVPAVALAQTAPASPALASLAPTDWRTPDPDNILVIDTNQGRIILEMAPELAPAHVAQVRTLARDHFYDGLQFFRVINGFMAQTGDPKNDGTGGSDLPDLKAEFEFRRGRADPFVLYEKLPAGGDVGVTEVGFYGAMPVRTGPQMQMFASVDGKTAGWGLFCPGVAGMARSGDPDSANSQFFLMRDTYPTLNSQYTAWGRVLSGEDVVRKIKAGPEDDKVPEPRDVMKTVRLLSDMPEKDRPKIQVVDTRSPGFRTMVAAQKAAAGGVLTICDVEIPAKVG
ncbi:MAG: peptidylprolyl isomerase [Caulobacter sp.]|nr:peptidylprolyl isomerase [Caulobacter sp.]